MYHIPGYFCVCLFSRMAEILSGTRFFFCGSIMGGGVVFTTTHICVRMCNRAQSKVTMACGIYVESCVCGYHTYEDIWEAAVGEELLCKREPNNMRDSYAVAVIKDDCVVEVLQQYTRIVIFETSHVKTRCV